MKQEVGNTDKNLSTKEEYLNEGDPANAFLETEKGTTDENLEKDDPLTEKRYNPDYSKLIV